LLVWVKPLQVPGDHVVVAVTTRNESSYGKKRIYSHG